MKYNFYAFLIICVVYKLPVWAIVVYLFSLYILRTLYYMFRSDKQKNSPSSDQTDRD